MMARQSHQSYYVCQKPVANETAAMIGTINTINPLEVLISDHSHSHERRQLFRSGLVTSLPPYLPNLQVPSSS